MQPVSRHDVLRCAAAGTGARVVCGVDGSAASLEALAQALRLRSEDGRLVAATACNVAQAVHAGFEAARMADDLRHEADRVRADARELLAGTPAAQVRLIEGRTVPALLRLAARERATLLAVGTHGRSRAAGIVLGGTATRLLHEAPCPLLVARRPESEGFPRAILVGFDGSSHASRALAAARELQERFGSTLRLLVARGGKPLRAETLAEAEASESDPRPPLEALVAASEDADLVVVGSRGLHGIRALGSISERIAHRARCSVLVVRPPAHGNG